MQLPPVGELLHTKMSRKQFLQTLGLLILTAVGVSAFIRFSQNRRNPDKPIQYGQ